MILRQVHDFDSMVVVIVEDFIASFSSNYHHMLFRSKEAKDLGEEKAPQMAVERISELRDTNEIKLWKISEGIVRTIQIYTKTCKKTCSHSLHN